MLPENSQAHFIRVLGRSRGGAEEVLIYGDAPLLK